MRLFRTLLTPSQKKYLAQQYNIDPAYAKGLYEGLPADRRPFDFAEVEKLAQDAHLWYKERKFRPSMGERLTGYAPSQSVYNPM